MRLDLALLKIQKLTLDGGNLPHEETIIGMDIGDGHDLDGKEDLHDEISCFRHTTTIVDTHDDTRQSGPLANEARKRVWDTATRSETVEDSAYRETRKLDMRVCSILGHERVDRKTIAIPNEVLLARDVVLLLRVRDLFENFIRGWSAIAIPVLSFLGVLAEDEAVHIPAILAVEGVLETLNADVSSGRRRSTRCAHLGPRPEQHDDHPV